LLINKLSLLPPNMQIFTNSSLGTSHYSITLGELTLTRSFIPNKSLTAFRSTRNIPSYCDPKSTAP
jgi:hypothetical protein